MATLAGFPYLEVAFDERGAIRDRRDVTSLGTFLATSDITDLFVIAHGWSDDAAAARSLYRVFFEHVRRLLESRRRHALEGRTFAILGILWPSRTFEVEAEIPGGARAGPAGIHRRSLEGELDQLRGVFGDARADRTLAEAKALTARFADSRAALGRFVDLIRSLLPSTIAEAADASDEFFTARGDDLVDRLMRPAPGTGVSWGNAERSGAWTAARRVLNYAAYYQMKERAAVVGSSGVNELLRLVRDQRPGLRLHLIGHSFGGGLMSAAVAGATGSAACPVNTLALLQPVSSAFDFARRYDGVRDGRFRRVVDERMVLGPILVTSTRNDRVAATPYAIASFMASGPVLGDEPDALGGIGSGGPRKTPETVDGSLQPSGGEYGFQAGRLYNLRADNFIAHHADVGGMEVADAVLAATEATGDPARSARPARARGAPRGGREEPPDTKHIAAWIGERAESPNDPLMVGDLYTLNLKVGRPVAGSRLTGEDARVAPEEIPPEGLDTRWVMTSRDVELAASSAAVTVRSRGSGSVVTWTAQFDLHIPRDGESDERRVRVTPRRAPVATIDISLFARGELFRQLVLELATAAAEAGQGARSAAPVGVKDDTVLTLPGELGFRPPNEWQTPPGRLQIIVNGDASAYVQGSIYTNGERIDVSETTAWHTSPTSLNGPITNVRGAAERLREDFETYLNDIEPADLAARLSAFRPLDDWTDAPAEAERLADARHAAAWDGVRASERLRDLAAEGYVLYQRLFPAGSDLRTWLDGLLPGQLLDIRWSQKDRAGVSSVPWSLVYMADPDEPIDPLRFMGLRLRLSYWAHPMPPTSQALGDPAATYRAHLLYWGAGETDAASVEARWQRTLWADLAPQVVTGPPPDGAKTTLLQVFRAPEPKPMTVLYFFCHCDVGDGNETVLRFGANKDQDNVVRQTELPNRPFERGPLVFANACTTAASDPTIVNELETRFFERGCRAFIGTETKVPIRLASRFASIFFHFFYRRASGSPVAAGEAMALARLFLWTNYKNIGGILYSYINRYDLLLAGPDELEALREPVARSNERGP